MRISKLQGGEQIEYEGKNYLVINRAWWNIGKDIGLMYCRVVNMANGQIEKITPDAEVKVKNHD